MVASSGAAQPLGFPLFHEPPTPVDLFATAASLRFSHFLHHRISHQLRVNFNLHSHIKKLAPLYNVAKVKDAWCSRGLHFPGLNFLQLSKDTLSSTFAACLYFFSGRDSGNNLKNEGMSWKTSNRNLLNKRRWTNILIAINVLAYLAQFASEGKLLLWGAKINHLIDQGQLWRLATSSFLHANIGHLMVNCYSLNSIGPAVEKISGSWRFLAVYIASAVASSSVSYRFCKAPSVGASGAIFGLVGSFAVFVVRHRNLVGGGKEELQNIARIIVLNMAIGILSSGIDNWGHLGGLLGGAAISWLLGPVWKHESSSGNGRRTFSDRAPIFDLINRRKKS